MEKDEGEKVLIWGVFNTLLSIGFSDFIKRIEKEVKKAGVNFFNISTEDCNAEAAASYRLIHPEASDDEVFDKAKDLSKDIFEKKVHAAVKQLKPGKNLIVFEKHSNGMYMLEHLNSTYKPDCESLLVAFIPKFEGLYKFNPEDQYGFVAYSLGIVAASVYRSVVMNYKPESPKDCLKKAHTALSFVAKGKGRGNLRKLFKPNVIDQFIEVSFTPPLTPERRLLISNKFFDLLRTSLKNLKEPFGKDLSCCQDIVDYIIEDEDMQNSVVAELASETDQLSSIKELLKVFDNAF